MSDTIHHEGAVSRKELRPAHKKASLYADHIKIHPMKIEGRYRRLKWIALILLLAIYWILPWFRWDRGPGNPDQALLLDMANARAYILWFEVWAQEMYYLTGVLAIAAIGLFFATSLFGRVWCGYACPQTVWTDLFVMVERWIEGDRNDRMRLDKAPMTAGKLGKRIAKHSSWLLISLLTGGAWVFYFVDAPTAAEKMLIGELESGTYFLIFLFTALTYLLAGMAREQVCTYMCPWPRFQSAMFDEDTLIVTYEKWRGEPRGKHHTGEPWDGRGHCIDCRKCIAVCPTGIDIRDGSQLECIGCGLCADACDTVMEKLNLPLGLVRYDTQRAQDHLSRGEARPPFKLVRMRTILYLMLMAAIGIAMIIGLSVRTHLDLTVQHERNPLFVARSDGTIQNAYTVKILNKQVADKQMQLSVRGLDGAALSVIGVDVDANGVAPLAAPRDTVTVYQVFVRVPRAKVTGEITAFDFILVDPVANEQAVQSSQFRGPKR